MIVYRNETWSATAAAELAAIRAPVTVEWYRTEAAAGRLALLGCWQDGRRVATVAYRIEIEEDRRTFVIVAAAGKGRALVAEALPVLLRLAADLDCTAARLHTGRPGLVRQLTAAGWGLREVVMGKELV